MFRYFDAYVTPQRARRSSYDLRTASNEVIQGIIFLLRRNSRLRRKSRLSSYYNSVGYVMHSVRELSASRDIFLTLYVVQYAKSSFEQPPITQAYTKDLRTRPSVNLFREG